MEPLLLDILGELERCEQLDDAQLRKLMNRHNRGRAADEPQFTKTSLLAWALEMRRENPQKWNRLVPSAAAEASLMRCLRLKPRRTASGVATISVLTKPWPCSSDCLYCPSDIRMPKSYLHDEPACQRAERNFFDPYLQVNSRLTALREMGHVTDKVELIVLGGTWNDYPQEYRIWFASELFRALNEYDMGEQGASLRRREYKRLGLSTDAGVLHAQSAAVQAKIDSGKMSYAQGWRKVYAESETWQGLAKSQVATLDELNGQQKINEQAAHRVVGLVVETRPDLITHEALREMRALGCTKVQMGLQSLDQRILDLNERGCKVEDMGRAVTLARAFGFKIHVHMMLNLLGATPTSDREDYRRLMKDPAFMPDEIKLYPCVLVESSRLKSKAASGEWRPYEEGDLISLLADDIKATPAHMRVSRMIRDISAKDIIAGNRKGNLRQLVEACMPGDDICEMRYREVAHGGVLVSDLRMTEVRICTDAGQERFLQWVAQDGRLAGFLRLLLPSCGYVASQGDKLPYPQGEAMIRELHVYGEVAALNEEGKEGRGPQHRGLGAKLVQRACEIAREEGYVALNVISAVGTRVYYRSLGFSDNGLYQRISL